MADSSFQSSMRRRFLRDSVFGACTIMLPGGIRQTLAQTGESGRHSGLVATMLRGGLMQISGTGGNIVLHIGNDSAALVDTGTVQSAPALADFITEFAAHVDLVLNTHWHEDHTGGNDEFGAAGARIIAHENTRLWMSTEYYVDWQDRNYAPRAAAALPDDTFFSSDRQPIVTDHAGEKLEYAHLPQAHTDGDIYARFPDLNVIVTGGVSTAGEYPVPDYSTGGWIGGLIDATAKLLSLADADTLVVPGRGPVRSREHLLRQHEMLLSVRERMEDLMRRGHSAEEMLAAGVTAEFDTEWGDNADRFVSNVYGGLWWVGRLTNSL